MWNIPDDPDFAPEPERCTLTKTKEYTRKFTKEGLAEKIDAVFRCDSYPKGQNVQHTFLFPLPLYPRTLYGQTPTGVLTLTPPRPNFYKTTP